MNNSVSTMSGKTKIKIVLLGNQSVGKSSIIEKYVKDCFDETSNVNHNICSPLLESIFSSKMLIIKAKLLDYNYGILRDSSDLDHSSPTI